MGARIASKDVPRVIFVSWYTLVPLVGVVFTTTEGTDCNIICKTNIVPPVNPSDICYLVSLEEAADHISVSN